MYYTLVFFFFFSSRRRHTRCSRDWSSDVCSSDLNATDVPILQIGGGSSTMSQADLNDYVSNFVRTPLATAQGSTIPFPYGGAPRLINVDLDLARLYAKGLSPADGSAAINAGNVILPA